MEYLDENEIIFWKRLIGRYLLPHAHSDETKAALKVTTKYVYGLFWLKSCLEMDDIIFCFLSAESTIKAKSLTFKLYVQGNMG